MKVTANNEKHHLLSIFCKLRIFNFYDTGPWGQFLKHFTLVTYDRNKIGMCILEILLACEHAHIYSAAYSTSAVSYGHKLFMKSTAAYYL
jgi:hypothetical protein